MKKYELLLKELEREIESCLDRGTLHFPTEKELCQHYGMSRQTVRKAIALLTDRGLLRSRQGSGIFLTGLKPRPTDNQVSVMLASPDEYIFPGIYGALNRSLSGRGFTLRLLENRGDFMRERAHLEDMLKTPPRALLTEGFSTLPSPNAPLYDALSAAGTSLLFLFAKSPNIRGQHCLHEDNAGGAAMLVRSLYEHGHRRIRGIFRTDTQQGMERCYGFLCALRDYGLYVLPPRWGFPCRRSSAWSASTQATSANPGPSSFPHWPTSRKPCRRRLRSASRHSSITRPAVTGTSAGSSSRETR